MSRMLVCWRLYEPELKVGSLYSGSFEFITARMRSVHWNVIFSTEWIKDCRDTKDKSVVVCLHLQTSADPKQNWNTASFRPARIIFFTHVYAGYCFSESSLIPVTVHTYLHTYTVRAYFLWFRRKKIILTVGTVNIYTEKNWVKDVHDMGPIVAGL